MKYNKELWLKMILYAGIFFFFIFLFEKLLKNAIWKKRTKALNR